MKILVVGGTGTIGSNIARLARLNGAEVTITARRAPAEGHPMNDFPVLLDDYTESNLTPRELGQFDAAVFSAGNDIRHIAASDDRAEFWQRTQIKGVPGFIRKLRDAGVGRVVHLGSYYHQALPHLVDTDDYVGARSLADLAARALSTPDCNVSTINPPSIVGIVPDMPTLRYAKLFAYARGELDIPPFAPMGGTNYMSVRSLAQAVWGALHRAEAGHAYLVGDENLSFRDYLQLFFDAVGNPVQIEALDADHPLLPVSFIVPGRNSVLTYEPNSAENAMLGYDRNDVRREVASILRALDNFDGTPTC